jgi:hypothetical protein
MTLDGKGFSGKCMDKIEKLKKRVDGRREDRERRKSMDAALRARQRDIDDAPDCVLHDFWCTRCKADFSGMGWKQTRKSTPPIAWYVGICPKGHEAIRRITDKADDPYYRLSLLVRRQRVDMEDDFLTPDNPRFKQLYPEQYKKLISNGQN